MRGEIKKETISPFVFDSNRLWRVWPRGMIFRFVTASAGERSAHDLSENSVLSLWDPSETVCPDAAVG